MATVHLLHGLPGSGKTTFAKQLEKQHRAILLNHDEWMVTLHGNNPPLEQFAQYAENISTLMWQLVARLIATGNDVVLDWGFWTRASRDEARARIVAAGGSVQLYRMACSPELARQRTLARTAASGNADFALLINAEAWDGFAAKFEPMADDELRVELSLGAQ